MNKCSADNYQRCSFYKPYIVQGKFAIFWKCYGHGLNNYYNKTFNHSAGEILNRYFPHLGCLKFYLIIKMAG